jgi:hypothetical protein
MQLSRIVFPPVLFSSSIFIAAGKEDLKVVSATDRCNLAILTDALRSEKVTLRGADKC